MEYRARGASSLRPSLTKADQLSLNEARASLTVLTHILFCLKRTEGMKLNGPGGHGATAVTRRGWGGGTEKKSWHRNKVDHGEKNAPAVGEPATFRSRVRRSNH